VLLGGIRFDLRGVETTPDVRVMDRTFQESVRFPWPGRPIRLVIRGRDRENVFRDLWTASIDPANVRVRATPAAPGKVVPLVESGSPGAKVDVLLISEGYSSARLPDFRAHAGSSSPRCSSWSRSR
jgi:hypothetical protein